MKCHWHELRTDFAKNSEFRCAYKAHTYKAQNQFYGSASLQT